MITACLFDMDGVLFDTERSSETFMIEAVARQGATLTADQFVHLIGTGLPKIYACFDEWFPGQIDHHRFACDWRDITFDHMRQHGMPFKPGADEVLRSLKARGVKLAICTSNTHEVVTTYLDIAGWSDIFDVLVTGDMVTHGKPDPEIFLKAMELLHVAPDECIGIEDSPGGVRAIRAAGIRSVMIPDRVPYSDALAPYVDICLDSLFQLESVILEKE